MTDIASPQTTVEASTAVHGDPVPPRRKRRSRPTTPETAAAAAIAAYDWMLPGLLPLAEPLESLRLDPRNARSHGGRSTESQIESLKSFGQVKPIIGNRRNHEIVAGNGLYIAMSELHKREPARWTHIAVAWGDYDEKTQAKLALADNRTAELSSWDDAALAEVCQLIEDEDETLFAALGLEELLPDPTPEDLGVETKVPARAPGGKLKTYQVVVECSDGADRRRLMTSLKKQGRRCRALTWEGEVKMPGTTGEERDLD